MEKEKILTNQYWCQSDVSEDMMASVLYTCKVFDGHSLAAVQNGLVMVVMSKDEFTPEEATKSVENYFSSWEQDQKPTIPDPSDWINLQDKMSQDHNAIYNFLQE